MTTRITGLATGMDIDSYVKAEMSVYQTKVDSKQKEKEVLEIKQEMYRKVISKGKELWEKYFDIVKDGSLRSSSTYATAAFASSDENSVTAKAVSASAIKDNYSVKVKQLAKAPMVILHSDLLEDMKMSGKKEIEFSIGEKKVSVDISPIYNSTEDDDKTKLSKLAKILNNELGKLDIKAVYSELSGGVIIQSNSTGEESKFILNGTGGALDKEYSGQDAKYNISNSIDNIDGQSKSNKVILDGVEYSFNAVTEAGKDVKLTCKNDADKLADKIMGFFDDYNKFIEEINTYLSDKRDRNYQPLTAEQKKDMSEDEIKLWNEKVKKGQLRRNSDISTFVTNLKTAMSTLVSGTNINLISVEIDDKSVIDKNLLGNKSGTISIDKKKLVSVLEERPEEAMKFFISTSSEKDDSVKQYNEKGIFNRLYDVLNDNCISITKSPLIKKAGISGAEAGSELTLEINRYASKLTEMKKDLSKREQKLYSKYARLEKVMNNYNNQLAKIQSMFQQQ